MATFVQQVLEHGQVLHAEHVNCGECGGMGGDTGIDVRAMLHQQGDGLDAALPCCHQQRVEDIQVGVGTRLQQHAHSLNIVVDNREVERSAPTVLICLRAFVGQLSIDIKARLNQSLQNFIPVAFGCQVQRADTGPADSGLAGGWD